MVMFHRRLKIFFLVLLISHITKSLWVYRGGQGKPKETGDLPSTEDRASVQTQLPLNLKERSLRVFHSVEPFGLEEDVLKERKASKEHEKKRASHRNDEEHEASESGFHYLKTPSGHRKTRNINLGSSDFPHIACDKERSCFGAGKCRAEKDPGPTTDELTCFCDAFCKVSEDCCADYAQACPTITRSNPFGIRDVERDVDWQCIQGDDLKDTRGVWMISSCPGNWTKNNITNKCTEPAPVAPVNYMYKDIVPVIDEKGNTYKNRFCALCHGIQANETHFYDVQQQCKGTFGILQNVYFNISKAMLTNCSYVTWKPPPESSRRYCLKLKGSETCSLQSPSLKDLCSSSIPGIVVDHSGSIYRNEYCALCSNTGKLSCGPPSNQTNNKGPVLSLVFGKTDRKVVRCLDGLKIVNVTGVIYANYSANCTLPAYTLALEVLTYVGLLLSIPCLLFVLVTYMLFKELRTLPGVNLINLSLSLLFAQSLFLGSDAIHLKRICTVIAALLHYFYLVSFVWMSIIAFDTYRAFSRTCPSLQRAKKWKRRFIALGWLPALVFVAICVSLDQSQVVDIGYGGSKSCWINNARSNLYFFVIPVAFSVVFNALFFILTLHAIRKTKKQTQRVAAVSNRQSNFKLFLKLAILMGFTWIFGYLKLLVSDYFAYPFVIFNSLQGVYIAVAFVFTSRVKKMYCQLCGGVGITNTNCASVVSVESRL